MKDIKSVELAPNNAAFQLEVDCKDRGLDSNTAPDSLENTDFCDFVVSQIQIF